MKQTKVISVSGNTIYTEDGPKTPIGNALFRAGDYVFADGSVVFGHQTGGGVTSVDVGGIPIFTYLSLFGQVDKSAKFKSLQQYADLNINYLSAGRFVNDKKSAFLLLRNPVQQINLLANEIVSTVDTQYIYDADIAYDDTGNALPIFACNTSHHYNYNDYHNKTLSWSHNSTYPKDAYGFQSGPYGGLTAWWVDKGASQYDAEYRIYKGTEILINLDSLVADIVDQANSIALAASPSDVVDAFVMSSDLSIEKANVKPDGSYVAAGVLSVHVRVGLSFGWDEHLWVVYKGTGDPPIDPAILDHSFFEPFVIQSDNYFYFAWTLESGVITDLTLLRSDKNNWDSTNILLQAPIDYYDQYKATMGTNWGCCGEFATVMPAARSQVTYVDEYRYPLNDDYAYVIHDFKKSVPTSYDIYDPDNKLIIALTADINGGHVINCIKKLSENKYLLAPNDGVYCDLILIDNGVATVIKTDESCGVVNSRFAETGKINKIKSGFSKFFETYGG